MSHILQTANYGYPSLYKNFSKEIMPPLADYGGGSGCGAMFFHDARWPEGFNHLLLTCDWGRSEVFSHILPENGATYDAQQDTFLKIPRPTDIDVDASGRMYVSSWKNGQFDYKGPDIGFVAQITPVDFVPKPVDDVARMSDETVVAGLNHPSAAWRITVQREILRRAESNAAPFVDWLSQLAGNESRTLESRVAAVYTLGQIQSDESDGSLKRLMSQHDLREHAIRALTDRAATARNAPADLVVAALSNENTRVRAAALIALGRIHAGPRMEMETEVDPRTVAAEAVLPLTVIDAPAEETEGDDWRFAHPERVIPHLAAKTLVNINAIDECIAALNGTLPGRRAVGAEVDA